MIKTDSTSSNNPIRKPITKPQRSPVAKIKVAGQRLKELAFGGAEWQNYVKSFSDTSNKSKNEIFGDLYTAGHGLNRAFKKDLQNLCDNEKREQLINKLEKLEHDFKGFLKNNGVEETEFIEKTSLALNHNLSNVIQDLKSGLNGADIAKKMNTQVQNLDLFLNQIETISLNTNESKALAEYFTERPQTQNNSNAYQLPREAKNIIEDSIKNTKIFISQDPSAAYDGLFDSSHPEANYILLQEPKLYKHAELLDKKYSDAEKTNILKGAIATRLSNNIYIKLAEHYHSFNEDEFKLAGNRIFNPSALVFDNSDYSKVYAAFKGYNSEDPESSGVIMDQITKDFLRKNNIEPDNSQYENEKKYIQYLQESLGKEKYQELDQEIKLKLQELAQKHLQSLIK